MRVRGKIVPAALVAVLSSGGMLAELERWEGNIKQVYADHLAGGLPTRCAGDTNHDMAVGTQLTDDQCREINKRTIVSYGIKVLACTNWDHLTPDRLAALTLFAINVGTGNACGSDAVTTINHGDIEAGCRLISTKPDGRPNWSYVGNRYVQGLQNRRKAEEAMCLGS